MGWKPSSSAPVRGTGSPVIPTASAPAKRIRGLRPKQQTTVRLPSPLVGAAPGPAHHVRPRGYIKAGNRTLSTADLRRSPRVNQRWFDSNWPSPPLESNTISTQDIATATTPSSPVSIGQGLCTNGHYLSLPLSVTAKVCEPTATITPRTSPILDRNGQGL